MEKLTGSQQKKLVDFVQKYDIVLCEAIHSQETQHRYHAEHTRDNKEHRRHLHKFFLLTSARFYSKVFHDLKRLIHPEFYKKYDAEHKE